VTRQYELEHLARPLPMNAYDRLHHLERARYVREWRSTFAWLARAQRVPRMNAVIITVVQTCRRPPLPDVAASYPTAKAAIDGLVDARVIPNDTPEHVKAITFIAPERADADRFLLLVEEDLPEGVRAL